MSWFATTLQAATVFTVCAASRSGRRRTEYARSYPFGWFGILARAAPYSKELVYAHHERGFSLVSTHRDSPAPYLQCDPADQPDDWETSRIRAELDECSQPVMADASPRRDPPAGVIAMRSFVLEPMAYGTLYLAGDAAHIVPPTGAKGLNLAVADVQILAAALPSETPTGKSGALDHYSSSALERVWAAEHFSWWMTSIPGP